MLVKRLVLLFVAGSAAFLVVGLSNGAATPTTVTCTDAFSGTAFNVVVPDDNFCVLSGATIIHDVIIGTDAGAGAGNLAGEAGLTVGHDVTLQHDSEVDFGATVIGHDLIGTTNDGFHLERTTIRNDLLAFQPGTVQTGDGANRGNRDRHARRARSGENRPRCPWPAAGHLMR